MPRRLLDRRTLLRGMFGGAVASVALPALDMMFNSRGDALANGTPTPTRFGLFFWGNGVRRNHWIPSATGAGYPLSELLQPLAGVRDYVSVLSGFAVKVDPGLAHLAGTTGILAGGAPQLRLQFSDSRFSTFPGPSVDQLALASLGGSTAFRSLELGVCSHTNQNTGTTLRAISHNGPNSPNPPEYSPHALFNSLFGGTFVLPTDPPSSDPRRLLRRSVLDVVTADANALRGRLGAVDRVRLEAHLDNIRALERRLEALPVMPPSPACSRPGDPGDPTSPDGLEPIVARSQAMNALLAMAFACDLTRVVSMMFNGGVDSTVFSLPGVTQDFHTLTHNEQGDQPMVNACVAVIIGQLADLLARLRALPEGDGNVLDHTCLLATSDTSEGSTHSIDEFPLLLAGRAGGALRFPGVHHRSTTAENASSVVLTALRAAGVNAPSFGMNEAYSDTVVPEVMA